jgi:hypothetical protein
MAKGSYYADQIRGTMIALADGFIPPIDPRHVEAWMRVGNGGTLDQLSPEEWEEQVEIAAHTVLATDLEHSEILARSYGL